MNNEESLTVTKPRLYEMDYTQPKHAISLTNSTTHDTHISLPLSSLFTPPCSTRRRRSTSRPKRNTVFPHPTLAKPSSFSSPSSCSHSDRGPCSISRVSSTPASTPSSSFASSCAPSRASSSCVFLPPLRSPLVLSFTDRKYSLHSVFFYWKSVLVCGVIKAAQLYLWITALASCGPVICVLFEQSPKVLFVLVGLVANTYANNRPSFLLPPL